MRPCVPRVSRLPRSLFTGNTPQQPNRLSARTKSAPLTAGCRLFCLTKASMRDGPQPFCGELDPSHSSRGPRSTLRATRLVRATSAWPFLTGMRTHLAGFTGMLVLAVITAQQTGSTTEPIQNARRRHCAASRSLNTPTRIGGSNGGFQNTTGLQGARGVVTNWYDYVCRGGTGLLLEQACTQSSNGIVAYGQNFRILTIQAMAVVDLLVKQGMKPSSRVLDIGCGWGRMAAYIVPFLDPTAGGRYSGFDQDCGEIKKAKQTLRKCGDGMDASFTCTHSKVENRYPFANQSFDLAFAYGAIAFEAQSWTAKRLPISILLEHLQEISRTLSPRGVAMISIYLVDEAVANASTAGCPSTRGT